MQIMAASNKAPYSIMSLVAQGIEPAAHPCVQIIFHCFNICTMFSPVLHYKVYPMHSLINNTSLWQ